MSNLLKIGAHKVRRSARSSRTRPPSPRSLRPGSASTPETTSTPQGPSFRIASETLAGLNPPATTSRVPAPRKTDSAASQSNEIPVPPTAVAVRESTRIASTFVSLPPATARSIRSGPKCSTCRIRNPGPNRSRSANRQLRVFVQMELNPGQSGRQYRRLNFVKTRLNKYTDLFNRSRKLGVIPATCSRSPAAGSPQTQIQPRLPPRQPPASHPPGRCFRKS